MARAIIVTSYLEHPLDIGGLLAAGDLLVCLDGGGDIARQQGITPDLLLGDFDSIRETTLSDFDQQRQVEIRSYPPEKDYTDLELAFRVLDPARWPDLLVIGGLGGRLDQTLINVQMLQRYTATPAEWAAFEADQVTAKAGLAGAEGRLAPGQAFRTGAREASDMAIPSKTVAKENGTAVDRSDSMDRPDPGQPDWGRDRKFRSIELRDGHHSCFVVHGAGTGAPTRPDIPKGSVSLAGMDPPEAPPASAEDFISISRRPDSFLSLLPLTDCRGVDLEGTKYPLKDADLERGSSLTTSNEFVAEEARLRIRQGSLLVILTR